jgi:ketosteroid isomerase-like protein
MFSLKSIWLCATAVSGFILTAEAVNITEKACHSAASQLPSTYPNKCQISKVFDNLVNGNFTGFFSHVSPNVTWTLMGTHPLAGIYTNRTIFLSDAIVRLSNVLNLAIPTSLTPIRIFGGGDEEWSSIELHATGVAKNGKCSKLIHD